MSRIQHARPQTQDDRAVLRSPDVHQPNPLNAMQTNNRPQTPSEIEAEKRQREHDQRWPLASADRDVRRQAIADFMRRTAAKTDGASSR